MKTSNPLISQALIKIAFLGPSQSGKSSIIDRYIKNEYTESMIKRIGVSFVTKCITFNEIKVKLQIVK